MITKMKIWSHIACASFLFAFALPATAWMQWGNSSIRDEGDAIVIENQSACLTVGKDGITRGFKDARNNTEYLDLRSPVYFMSVRRGTVEFGSSRISKQGNDLNVKFGGSGIEARVRVGVKKGYFTFEVISVNQSNLDELIVIDLPLTISERVPRVQEPSEHSETINICRNDQFGVCLASVNLIAHSRTTRYEPAAFRSSCYTRFGMVGAKVALLAGPAERMLDLIGKMEVEQGLPHPTLGGEWGKVSREIQKSYLFIDFTEANIDRVIELAKAGGFPYILNYGGTWSKSDGKYEVNTRNFPNGLSGLKAVMDKIHAAGLKGGAHMLAGGVDKHNAYLTPVPDPRLAKDDMRILAKDLGISDTTLVLTTSPTGLPLLDAYGSSSGKSLVVDNEVITYQNLKNDHPFALEGCTRGAYGTKASSHRAGSYVYHLSQRWGNFIINADSDMLQEVAQNVADVINTCGFDQIYFDGLDGVQVNGPFFYYVGKLVQETTKRFKRDVIVQGSNLAHINWHDFSRLYTIDVNMDMPQKRWVDYHCSQRLVNALYNLMPGELGWFGYAVGNESTTPDIMEYVLAKTIGWSVPWSLETSTGVLTGNGRTPENLALCKIYEELRFRNYFSDRVKEVLRTPRQDFKLVEKGSGQWQMHPVNYGPARLLSLEGNTVSRFTHDNLFQEQPLKFRIKARPAAAAFGDRSNRVLVDPDQTPEGTASSGSPDFPATAERSSEQVKTGRTSLKLSGVNRASGKNSWAARTFQLTQAWDPTKDGAIGFWLYGDASGVKLHLRLDDGRRRRSRSHYVVLNFSGWKYFEMADPWVDPVTKWYYPHTMPGDPAVELNPGFEPDTTLDKIAYNDAGFLTLLLTDVPPGKTVTCYLGRLEALKEFPTTLINPTLSFNGTAVRLPVTLTDHQYVEYWGEKDATVYDKNGFTLGRFPLKGAPLLRGGVNQVEVRNEADSGARTRVRIELVTMGDVLK
ncbi:MAG: hypothetical protein PHR77_13330 [Kiritimatiellae bacterium]|nr:hypothetical protein [Kiritimatiellia bacterium]MDD5523219.1 hypothetical protein [Kiritimatiellia bacterium]